MASKKADLVWDITKSLYPDNITGERDFAKRYKCSDLKIRGAVQWLVKRKFAVRNGALIALTELGKQFHDKRKEVLDN